MLLKPLETAAGLLIMALAALPGGAALANDSTAELATGGLLLTKSDDIEMRSEDLYISPRQIRVSYRFYNTSGADVTTVVAFPMPDVTVADVGTSITLPTKDPENLLGFSTSVEGTPVKARILQKVLAKGGVDRTADLERLKVPLAPHLPATDKALGKLPRVAQDELKRLGLADVEEYSAGRSMRQGHPSPRWTLQTTYYWEQTFPAGKEIAVEHRYKPSIGRSAQTMLGDPGAMTEGWYKDYARKYCLDPAFLAAVERARNAAKSPYGAPFSEERISYSLSTGSNWARPIGRFRLVVDTGDPSSLVSFCGEEVKKVGPSQYEMRKDGFLPDQDLHVLILKPSKHR
jgi:Domain of unknown function (DUF4424)